MTGNGGYPNLSIECLINMIIIYLIAIVAEKFCYTIDQVRTMLFVHIIMRK